MTKASNYINELRNWIADNPGKRPADFHAYRLRETLSRLATKDNPRTNHDTQRLSGQVSRAANPGSGDSLV